MINKIREEKERSKEREKNGVETSQKFWRHERSLEILKLSEWWIEIHLYFRNIVNLTNFWDTSVPEKIILIKMTFDSFMYCFNIWNHWREVIFFITCPYTCGWWEVGEHYVRNWLYNLLMKFLVEDSSDFIKRRSSLVTSIEFNIWSILSICDSTLRSKEVDWLNKSPIAHFKYKFSSIR